MEPVLGFRSASQEDVGTVVALVNGAYRGDESRRGWTTEADLLVGARTNDAEIRALIDADDTVLLLCECDGETIGCVQLEHSGDAAYLGLLVVRPDLQARGIGKRFIAAAEDFVRARWSVRRIWMTVISVREELLAWYERRGYHRTGVMKPFPPRTLSTPLVDGLQFETLEKTFGGKG